MGPFLTRSRAHACPDPGSPSLVPSSGSSPDEHPAPQGHPSVLLHREPPARGKPQVNPRARGKAQIYLSVSFLPLCLGATWGDTGPPHTTAGRQHPGRTGTSHRPFPCTPLPPRGCPTPALPRSPLSATGGGVTPPSGTPQKGPSRQLWGWGHSAASGLQQSPPEPQSCQ